MNYELAKQLKDAGFPLVKLVQPLASHEGGKQFCFMCGFPFVEINGELYHMPLVETLVEACGDRFSHLSKAFSSVGVWTAWADSGSKVVLHGNGSTPIEAVAMLYLALHGKTWTSMEGR